jgi:hypothetical protein
MLPWIDASVYSCPIQAVTHVEASAAMENADTVFEEDEYSLLSKLSTCLIFNTALAHHATAVTEPSTPRVRAIMLNKAKDLYTLAYSFQTDEERSIGAVNPLYIMATCNNLGRCYAQLGDVRLAQSCFEVLLQYLVVFQQQQRQELVFQRQDAQVDDAVSWRVPVTTDRSTSSFPSPFEPPQDDSECFYENTLFLILKDPRLAPAA